MMHLKRWIRPVSAVAIFIIFALSWGPFQTHVSLWALWAAKFGLMLLIPALYFIAIQKAELKPRIEHFYQWIKTFHFSRWLWVVCAVMFVMAYVLSHIIYGHLPGQMDAYAYYIQAKIFASGHWYAKSHPLSRFFGTMWFVNDGKYYSQYPPGYPMVLAVALLLGIPSLLSPALAALGIVFIYYIGKELGNIRVARLASLLALASPVIAFMSAEYMSHMFAWVCTNGFVLFYIRAHRYGKTRDAWIGGAMFAWLFITRSQVAAAIALPFALHWMLPWTRPKWEYFWKCGIPMLMMALAGVVFILYYNEQTTGDMFVTQYEKYQTYKTFREVLNQSIFDNMNRMLYQTEVLSRRLFGWPITSFIFIWLLFQMRLQKRYAGVLIMACLAVALSLMAIIYDGGIYKPRYLFEINGMLIALTALGIDRLIVWLRVFVLKNWSVFALRGAMYGFILLLSVTSYPTVEQMYQQLMAKDWPDHSDPAYFSMVQEKMKKPALVFFPWKNYYMESIYNPPRDDAPIIAALDYKFADQPLMDYYPDRYVYFGNGTELKFLRGPKTPPTDKGK